MKPAIVNRKQTLPKDDTFEKIFAWYVEGEKNVQLSPVQEEQRKRYEAAFSLLVNYHSQEQAVQKMMQTFSIGKSTAYTDVRDAIRLFGDVHKSSREGQRHILYEYSMRVFQLAANQRPPDIKGMNQAIANMIKLKGLDRDDIDIPDFSQIQPVPVMIGFFPELNKIELPDDLDEQVSRLLQTKKKKNLSLDDISDVSYEEA